MQNAFRILKPIQKSSKRVWVFRNTGANAVANNQTRLAYEDKRDLYCRICRLMFTIRMCVTGWMSHWHQLLVEESSTLEAKFGRPQLQQIQGSDEFARAWYSMVVMFKHYLWSHDSQLSHGTACWPHLQGLLQILQRNLGLYFTMLVYVVKDWRKLMLLIYPWGLTWHWKWW